MIENRAEQKEALETLLEFNVRLVKNMNIIVKELSGERLEDTEAFLNDIVQAMNWEIQVFNGTMELLNEDKVRIEKEMFNEKIKALGDAIAAKDDAQMAEKFTEVIPVFEALGEAAKEVTAK
ncbi:molecular chaperone [Lachnospiraceae bacterium KK002]